MNLLSDYMEKEELIIETIKDQYHIDDIHIGRINTLEDFRMLENHFNQENLKTVSSSNMILTKNHYNSIEVYYLDNVYLAAPSTKEILEFFQNNSSMTV